MPHQPKHAAVWFEIPVRDLKAGMAFYAQVFDFDLSVTPMEWNDIVMLPSQGEDGVGGNLYAGTPGTHGHTIHIPVPDSLEATADRCRAAGGAIVGEPIALPSGRFVYATDPDGNSIGLFEFRGD
ncbi:VOC family protein [Roseobacter sp. HKCCA0434]|uniref:VOC family protein n=1 Tax=Roseobacter sp. HKCCA0434 TaxID=3079297 RepID=UPI0029059EBF|nr:VOC family protein [Roseobacter sp. HKCCA0434]